MFSKRNGRRILFVSKRFRISKLIFSKRFIRKDSCLEVDFEAINSSSIRDFDSKDP
jgi:hypothetical protein